jgi:uncharacterized protein YjbI with pentapeptide repeats
MTSYWFARRSKHTEHQHPFLVFDTQDHLHFPLTLFAKEACSRLGSKTVPTYLYALCPYFTWLDTNVWQVRMGQTWDASPQQVRRSIDDYLVQKLQCQLLPQHQGWKYVAITAGTKSTLRIFLAALKLYYQIMRERQMYSFANPLVDSTSMTIAAAVAHLEREGDEQTPPRMPDQSGVEALRNKPKRRLTDSYYKLEHDEWQPQIIDDPMLPGYILKGGQTLPLDILQQGVETWNQWREEHTDIQPDLSDADLRKAKLSHANLQRALLTGANLFNIEFHEANLEEADLSQAFLRRANLSYANLQGTDLKEANLHKANLSYANLRHADLWQTDFRGADFSEANLGFAHLSEADLSEADLSKSLLYNADLTSATLSSANLSEAYLALAVFGQANLSYANLRDTDLSRADLNHANFSQADLSQANLSYAALVGTDLRGANLNYANLRCAALVGTDLRGTILRHCSVYGISAWNVKLEGARQESLVITRQDGPNITVDNLKIAQFIYLLLNNTEIRDIIDTITSKVVNFEIKLSIFWELLC